MAEWISVKDRLPDDYIPVLACDCRGNMHVRSHFSSYAFPFGIGRNGKRYYVVKYWMELPGPPAKRA